MKKTNHRICIDLDGQIVACTDGLISGGSTLQRRRMKAAGLTGERIRILAPFGELVPASLDADDPLGNFAAIAAASGRWKIIEAPDVIYKFLESQHSITDNPGDSIEIREIEYVQRA